MKLSLAQRGFPPVILFFDVETTGLEHHDRIVSIAFIELETEGVEQGIYNIKFGHFIVNPGIDSHPKAFEVHGYSDRLLKYQKPFSEIANSIYPSFERAGMFVAHNISFDLRFIQSHFYENGLSIEGKRLFCTMLDYRENYRGKSGLDHAISRFNLKRRSDKHSALEDTWLCMGLWANLHNLPFPQKTPDEILRMPTNMIEPPPL